MRSQVGGKRQQDFSKPVSRNYKAFEIPPKSLVESGHSRKTAYEIFLEDDGPYSRKFYAASHAVKTDQRKQGDSGGSNFCEAHDDGKNKIVMKSLLWYKSDNLFSR